MRTESLGPIELAKYPVWEYINPDDTLVRPVVDLPVISLRGRIVGTKLKLSNGMEVWAILSNVHLRNIRKHEQFLAVWIIKDGQWCELARYHDVDRNKRSPDRLAHFLGVQIEDVFPLSYDISTVAIGLPEVVHGIINVEPKEKLTREQLVRLTFEPDDDATI